MKVHAVQRNFKVGCIYTILKRCGAVFKKGIFNPR